MATTQSIRKRTEEFGIFSEDFDDGMVMVVTWDGDFDDIPIGVKEAIELNHVYGDHEPSLRMPEEGEKYHGGEVTFPVKDSRVRPDEIEIDPADGARK